MTDVLTYYGGKAKQDSVPKMLVISPIEEKELWRIRKRSPRARELLVKKYICFAFRAASKYKGPRLTHDDAVSAANAGMMEAMSRYDPKKSKAHFTTYCALFMRRHLINALIATYPVHVSDRLRKKDAALEKDPDGPGPKLKPGDPATIEELFERLTVVPESDIVALHEKTEEAPAMPYEGANPADEAETSLLPEELRAGVREALNTLERQVIKARYYTTPPESFDSLGDRLGQTKIHLREVHDLAIVKLRRWLNK